MRKISSAALLLSAGLLVANTSLASPITIDFESLAGSGLGGPANVSYGSLVNIDGFTFSTNAGFGFRAATPINSNYLGSVALVANEANATTTLSQSNNAAFDIFSIGLAYSNLAQQDSNDLTFFGTRADSSVVSQTFTIDNNFSTYAFNTSFSNLLSLSWTQLQSEGNNHQFDNVSVDGSPSSVPEPASLLLMLSGLLGMSLSGSKIVKGARIS